MTAKTIYLIKMISAVFLIVSTPAFFFRSVGHNPMEVKENVTRTIAVVNEDNGADEEQQALQFGNDVIPLLEDESDYKWTVLGRSAAENGLKGLKYDAVVYIPSDFSRKIMTYDEQQPEKADFGYKVQDQLNAINREKVTREIEHATNRVNQKMSSLFWSYVAQDMDNVRTEFDEILQKEIDFQNTMAAFYKPSSLNLAGEIDRQKQMLEHLRTNIQQTGANSPSRQNNVKQFEQNLASFVKYVEEYKTYQDKQQEVLKKIQDESVAGIQKTTADQGPRYEQSKEGFKKQEEQLFAGVTQNIQMKVESNNKNYDDLYDFRTRQIESQLTTLPQLQEQYLDTYKQKQDEAILASLELSLAPLREELGEEDAGEGGTPASPEASVSSNGTPGETVIKKPGDILPPAVTDISETLNQLETTMKNLGKLERELAKIYLPPQQMPIEIKAPLDGLKADISQSILVLKPKIETDKKVEEFIKELIGTDYTHLYATYEKQKTEYENERTGITNKFNLFSSNLTDMIQGVNKKEEILPNLNDEVNSILVNPDEKDVWEKLKAGIPLSPEELSSLEGEFAKFVDEYNKNLETEHTATMENLSSIQESASKVLTQILNPSTMLASNAPEPSPGANDTTVVADQKSIGQEMLMINEWMGSLGESQDSIVAYTGELQDKVKGVQNDADALNNKWADNVASTKLIRDDVFNVLGNTFVDGQNNGYVYEHLSNPLKISGDAPIKEEAKKVPPVVILVIILISSLLIGYFSHYFSGAPLLVQGSMFILLNLIVGLIISLFGLNIYSLEQERAIEWSIFTILLLTAGSTLIRVGFSLGNFIGWLAGVGLVVFFVSPLLALTAPNIEYTDPMSEVYMSIQYGIDSMFSTGVLALSAIIIILSAIPFAMGYMKNARPGAGSEQANEV
ncbi:type VII secretion protein EsaA [Bacillus sp. T33-2]|uniref:type VII secretion protein EsaA n=1 Tax=Bacillus sp. T33-2 TaxID=2054168 RepID=UPI000C75982E|nr:type VII secretion protein EsaA [Bacillus sp. T33-2]PLR96525.1 type VII secretion protein EsaA [Bacillus sp. T33-2]